ncbi:immunoreactive mannoprotein MP88 [Coprinopsis cinerea okayama7|uniref:Immunoreactive mannoprotein MP88 n=1 Tax=Coprinopsis cinerea (strain Okayama-7 / 130 / ATCC MYA-4618 / FGSC 9003) TaxID=240176 RepID=A8P1Z4_COPC7|nr:immunoreactive mannoprotein MP88 [Coprinopsis cinerea okayama7\|eukprot:XP_001838205.1 immunoreactive mannoprotein MP88 [Coprinopsis cinerea okayama7\
MISATYLVLFLSLATPAVKAQQTGFPPGVIATGPEGPTNPPRPTLGTPINQTSMARLVTVNSVDDFCLFAPPNLEEIGDSETYEVAWCTKPRNNARVIPDGTLTGVTFLRTDFYVQVIGFGNFTKLNIPQGDYGGELDPHGQYGDGNPIGGNVTSNITGSDQNFAEWMLYIDYNQFCMRVCTNANSTYSAADMCWHELDEMGCEFVMPADYNVNGTLSHVSFVNPKEKEIN